MSGQKNYRALYELEKVLYRVDNSNNLTEFAKLILGAERAGDDTAAQAIRQDMIASGVDTEKLDKKLAEIRKAAVTDTEEYQTELAALSESYATMLESSDTFNSMDAELQDKARTTMTNYAQYQVLGDRIEVDDDKMANLAEIEASGMNPADWVVFKTQFDSLHNDKDENGKDIPGQTRQDKAIKLIEQMYETDEERCAVYRSVYTSDPPWA